MRPALSLAVSFAALVLIAQACVTPVSANLPTLHLLPLADTLAGKLLFIKEGNIWLWAGGRARQLTTGGTWRQPQWSPDGAEIAYVYRSTNFSEIFLMNADGSNHRRLTNGQSQSLSDNDWVFHPTWSPNGAQIAYVSDSDSFNPTVWLMNKDGSGKRQLAKTNSFQEASDTLAWSPDGKRLAVTSFGSDVSQVVLFDVARLPGQPATESPKGALDPAWSPDGDTLAYAAREGGRVDIRLRRLDGSPEAEVTHGGLARAPVWSPDGTHLAYVSSRGGSFEVYVVDVVSKNGQLGVTNERPLTRELNVDATSGLSWSS